MSPRIALALLLAACSGGDGPASSTVDAGADSAAPSDDAAQAQPDASPDASGEDTGDCTRGACLGIDCPGFDASEGTGVQVEAGGTLRLQDGVVEGELRHVFEPCEGLVTFWHSVTVSGSLAGVALDVRAGNAPDDLDQAPWQTATSGALLPALGEDDGCGFRFLEVRVRLRVVDGAKAPSVDRLEACHACSHIFC